MATTATTVDRFAQRQNQSQEADLRNLISAVERYYSAVEYRVDGGYWTHGSEAAQEEYMQLSSDLRQQLRDIQSPPIT